MAGVCGELAAAPAPAGTGGDASAHNVQVRTSAIACGPLLRFQHVSLLNVLLVCFQVDTLG